MHLLIRKDCKTTFMDPYNIDDADVLATFMKYDKYQRVDVEDVHFTLYVKRIANYYLLIKAIKNNSLTEISEVYKVDSELIDLDRWNSNYLQVLSNYFQLIGSEFEIAGVKSRFLFDERTKIGIPKIEDCNFEIVMTNFFKFTDSRNQYGFMVPFFKIQKGNAVDFLRILLFYIFDAESYSKYLEKYNLS